MSSGVKGAAAGSRVPIPSSVKKTIENIKEITGKNHNEDEIYAMLKECSMDPNETTQKLLLLDTFHEVKKKRDRRKENLNKEPAESKWKPGSQARVNRAGHGNYSSRHVAHDAGSVRNSSAVKESATSHISEKGVSKAPLATTQDMKKNEASSIARCDSPITEMSNGSSSITCQSSNFICDNHVSTSGGVNQCNETGHTSTSNLEGTLPLSSAVDSILNTNLGTGDIPENEMLDSSNSEVSLPSAPASGSNFSSLDPVLLPSQNFPLLSAVGTIRHEVGSQRTPVELIADNPTERKSASTLQPKLSNDLPGVGKTQYLESLQTASSSIGVSAVSRPSSSYNNWSPVVGLQKVGPSKEWKPKYANPSIGQDASSTTSPEVSTASIGNHSELQQSSSNEAAVELQRKLEALHISNSRHVIIPNHFHVPEAGKLGFCFGSFDASFGLDMIHKGSSVESDKSPPLSESSEAIDEPVKELQLSNQTVLEDAENTEIEYADHVQSPTQERENVSSSGVEVLSSPDYGEPKQEIAPGSRQQPVVHTSSNYSYGFMPPTLGGHLTPFEGSEPQARDVPRLPGFVVHQSFDPASYYAQFYRSSMDSDGRISPLHSAGAANKYNGNAALASAQAFQSHQEGGAPLVFSTASPVPLVTQAAGVMQSSVTATQQPFPVFRQPTGIHLPHYPPFIPYGPYFSPFYVPPPAIHQFLSNGAFPQQPQVGSLYATPPGTNAKYSVSQYKQGSKTGSSTHCGMPGSYGPHGLPWGNYTSILVTAAVTTTPSEDLAAPQVKDNNIYVSAQQTEGSGVNQGQLAFNPTQPGHGTFTGIFHPAHGVTAATVHPLLQQSQAVPSTLDTVGQTVSAYQQQHAQSNWPSNY